MTSVTVEEKREKNYRLQNRRENRFINKNKLNTNYISFKTPEISEINDNNGNNQVSLPQSKDCTKLTSKFEILLPNTQYKDRNHYKLKPATNWTSVSLHLNMPITKASLCCSPKLAGFSKFGRCFPLNGHSSRYLGFKFITACVSIDHVRET